MTFNDISTFFSTVGVPTGLCCYMIYVNYKNNLRNAEVIEKLRETVENNTKAMIKLCTKLGVDTDG